MPTIKRVLPIREIRKQIRSREHAFDGRVVGTTHDFAEFSHLEIVKGRFLEPSDDQHYRNYAVLAHAAAETLFPYEDPVGQTIVLGNHSYSVIGVTGERGRTAASGGGLAGQDFDRDVYIPLNTCRVRFGERIVDFRSGGVIAEETQLTQITVQVQTIDEVTPTVGAIQGAYEPFHPKKDVQMTVPYDLLEEARRIGPAIQHHPGDDRLDLAPGRRHRHHEHHAGHRDRAHPRDRHPPGLGAKQRDIIQQFLIECVVLSGVGGVVGVLLGMGLPMADHLLLPRSEIDHHGAIGPPLLRRLGRSSASSSASTRPGVRRSWTRSRPCGTNSRSRVERPREPCSQGDALVVLHISGVDFGKIGASGQGQ